MPDSYPQPQILKRLRQLSRILDKAVTVPGTPIHIGLDPLMGFIPVGGDFLGIILASYIVLEAAKLGVPKSTLTRMVLNVIIDGLIGTIPVIGDLFDFAWTANEYNIQLLEQHLQLPLRK
ncbi:DUF4112 domain-containing protein [Chrysosporum bergii ANA360D]|jgi:hypothetical protein|uniref:DUF4112 domain-containing protein n=1 Tax=Chrysosporum bergii ANA360D TaxID=617107 RepID=A0AA43GTS7_9CYAN|nr:DUF4112 domain-containing protein [Chrysosporum bergii]MDH6061523.1 DUF4112 domain-containing protein [Chrysosporum bergii ANA360D]